MVIIEPNMTPKHEGGGRGGKDGRGKREDGRRGELLVKLTTSATLHTEAASFRFERE
jgi:hypothetical protein